MNILVTNDDSIYAAGLKALVKALSEVATVYVCAPDTQKSACGHGITVTTPIVVRETEMDGAEKAWKISGTPADCVKLALRKLVKDVEIDLVYSGINHGSNLGTDVLYSGTVSGALEGIVCGIPSIAVSLDSHIPKSFEACQKIAVDVMNVAAKNLTKNTVLNINIPNVPKEEIKGVLITKLGPREYEQYFEDRKNPMGQLYFWYGGAPVKFDGVDNDLDVSAVVNGYISITPLHYDLTSHSLLEEVKNWGIEWA